jgi:hypothetical protein
LLRQAVELGLEVAPPVALEHRPVGGGRPVEGDLAADVGVGLGHLLLGGPGHHEGGAGELEVVERPTGLLESALEGGHGDLAQVGLGGEGVAQHPVGHLARHLCHQLAHGGQEDPGPAGGVRARIEEGRHERVGVEVASEVELLAGVPRLPDRLDG